MILFRINKLFNYDFELILRVLPCLEELERAIEVYETKLSVGEFLKFYLGAQKLISLLQSDCVLTLDYFNELNIGMKSF